MAKLDPWQEDLVHEVDTQNIAAGYQVNCSLAWKHDFPAGFAQQVIATKSAVDSRKLHLSRYAAQGSTSGNASTDVDHAMSWNGYANTNEMEIFAVIRAEYRFIGVNGWQKLAAKKASQGIDSLFYRNAGGTEYFAIVESKCTSNVSAYNKYCGGSSPLGRLGKANPKVGNKPLRKNGVTQMTEPWVYHAFLQEAAGNPNATVIGNLEQLWAFVSGGGATHKWMNVYGTDVFHMVPGVYQSAAVIAGVAGKKSMEDIEVDWPDDPYRNDEFFALTAGTNADASGKGLVAGTWHDMSAEFKKLCDSEDKQINQARLQQFIQQVDDEFG